MAGRKAKKYRHFLSPHWHKEKENYKYNLVGNLYTIVDVLKNELDEKNFVIRSLLLKLVKDIAVLVNDSDRKGSIHDDDSVVESLVSLNNALGSIVDDVNGFCDKTVNVYQSLNDSIENLVDKGNRSEACESKDSDDGDENNIVIEEKITVVVKEENSSLGGEDTHQTVNEKNKEINDDNDENEVDSNEVKVIEPKIQRTFVSESYAENDNSHDKGNNEEIIEEKSTNVEVNSETDNNDEQKLNIENNENEEEKRTENDEQKDDDNESSETQNDTENDEKVIDAEGEKEDLQVNDLNADGSLEDEDDASHKDQVNIDDMNENNFSTSDESDATPVDYGDRLFAETLIQSLHKIANELSKYLDKSSKRNNEAENVSSKDKNVCGNAVENEDEGSINGEQGKYDKELKEKEEIAEKVDSDGTNESESDSNEEINIDIKAELRCTYCMEYDNPKTKDMGVIEDLQVDDKNKSEKEIQCQYCNGDASTDDTSISDDEISDVSVSNGDEAESTEENNLDNEIKDEGSNKDIESNVNATNSIAGEECKSVGEIEEECNIDDDKDNKNDENVHDESKSNETHEKSEECNAQEMKEDNDEENDYEALCTGDELNESEIDADDICKQAEKDSISDMSEYDENDNCSETPRTQTIEEKLVVLLTEILTEHTKCQFSDEETNCEVEKKDESTDDEKTDGNCNELLDELEDNTNEDKPCKNDTEEGDVNDEVVTNDENDNTDNKCNDKPDEESKCEMSDIERCKNDATGNSINNGQSDSGCEDELEDKNEAERNESEMIRDVGNEENDRADISCNDEQEDEKEGEMIENESSTNGEADEKCKVNDQSDENEETIEDNVLDEKDESNDKNFRNESEKEKEKNTDSENDNENDEECKNDVQNANNEDKDEKDDTSDNQEDDNNNDKEEACEHEEVSTTEETKDVDNESDKLEQSDCTETLCKNDETKGNVTDGDQGCENEEDCINHENIEVEKNMKIIGCAKIEEDEAIETPSTNSSIKGYEINKISRTNSIASSACDNCHPDEGEIDTQLVIEVSDSTDEDEEECSTIIQNLTFTYSDRNLTTEEQIWEYREKQDFTYKSKLEAQKKFPFDTIFIASDCILKGLETETFSERFHVVLRQFGGINVEDMFSQIECFLDMEPDYLILHVGTHNTMDKSSVQILEEITNLKQDIETYLPSCMVIVSQPVLRLDNRKSAFTILNLNEKLNNDEIDCVIENTNIQPEHLKKDGVHLNDLGLELITSNFAELIEDL